MKSSKSKSNSGTIQPPLFPALTKAQREWIAARRCELKSAINSGIESGKKSGYREFEAERLLSFIEGRRSRSRSDKKKRA